MQRAMFHFLRVTRVTFLHMSLLLLLLVRFLAMLEHARHVRQIVRIVRKQLIVVLGMFAPQVVNQISGYVVARVVGDHAYHEYAVRFQVVVQEVIQTILSHLNRLVDETDATLNPLASSTRQGTLRPYDHLTNVPQQHDDVPEPDCCEYLLVK